MTSFTLEEKYRNIAKDIQIQTSTNPISIVRNMMEKPYISIHGPEHHFLDGASLLVAMRNAGLKVDIEYALQELSKRTISMPGAMCGYWGVCGSVTSLGSVFSIIDGTGPLSSDETYSAHMRYTSKVIVKMSEIGGPRCCKRNAFLSLNEAIQFANERYSLKMEIEPINCSFSQYNKQCIGIRCPFFNDKK